MTESYVLCTGFVKRAIVRKDSSARPRSSLRRIRGEVDRIGDDGGVEILRREEFHAPVLCYPHGRCDQRFAMENTCLNMSNA